MNTNLGSERERERERQRETERVCVCVKEGEREREREREGNQLLNKEANDMFSMIILKLCIYLLYFLFKKNYLLCFHSTNS